MRNHKLKRRERANENSIYMTYKLRSDEEVLRHSKFAITGRRKSILDHLDEVKRQAAYADDDGHLPEEARRQDER